MTYDPLEQMERWAALARAERPPETQVQAPVLAELRERRRAERSLGWMAAAAASAAALMLLYAYPTWMTLTDPLGIWLQAGPGIQ